MWYIIYNNKQIGPLTEEQLIAYNLNPNSKVWKMGMPQWVDAYTVPELMVLISKNRPASNPNIPPTPNMSCNEQAGTSDKDKTTAGILAILLGGLGIQYFYLNKTTAGLLTILLCIVTCGFWSILTFVQGILMLTMTQQEFEQKYVYSTTTLPLF